MKIRVSTYETQFQVHLQRWAYVWWNAKVRINVWMTVREWKISLYWSNPNLRLIAALLVNTVSTRNLFGNWKQAKMRFLKEFRGLTMPLKNPHFASRIHHFLSLRNDCTNGLMLDAKCRLFCRLVSSATKQNKLPRLWRYMMISSRLAGDGF